MRRHRPTARRLLPVLPVLAVLAPAAAASPAAAQGTRLLRQPAVSGSAIAFVHANDVWVVGRDGGVARRLTSGEGAETEPAFSPDGSWIAFTGEYGGNPDVYVVPTEGGQPRRLTWHPGSDVVQGWTPDGSAVVFRSGREGHPTATTRFFTVPLDGGLPVALPIPRATSGELSPDGRWIAYQEVGFWDPEWRNYRGGQAQPISVVSMDTWERVTPPWEGERQMDPVWLGDEVFFVSERDWAANVWSWNRATGQLRQRTHHADFDVKSVASADSLVVYEQGGWLHALDPASDRSRRLDIEVRGDLNQARERWEEVPAAGLTNARLSPTGKRALFEHRGEVFSVPVDEGSWRNLTRSPGVADRYPVWSPRGDRVAWFSDEGGEYALVVADQDGGDPRTIALAEAPTFYFTPAWSPDGGRIALTDTDYRLLVVDLASGRVTHVDTDRYAHPERTLNPVWSPDGRWLAYARRLDNQLRAVFVYDAENDRTRQVSDGMADAISPVWDASGRTLWFLASTDYALNTGWLDMTSYDRPVTRALYGAVLRRGDPSPFRPRSDEEAGPREGDATDETDRDGAAAPDAVPDVTIDFDGIAGRIVDAPGLPPRDYTGLVEGPAGKVFVLEAVPDERGAVMHRYDVEAREATTFLDGVLEASASADRKKLLLRRRAGWSVADAGGAPPQDGGERLALDGLRVRVDPRAEWEQMLRDGWRFMRDFLYVENVHGAPWDDVWSWYAPWLESVDHRSDFNALLDMVSGEVSIGHSYVSGGDYPDLTDPETGLLGVDLEEDGGWYRIARVYTGEGWTAGLDGPLSVPGMDVEAGDWLVAIDGRPLRAPTNPYELLEGTAGRTVTVSVNDRPSDEGARELVVEPVSSEGQLRTRAWVEENRAKVDRMSDGRLAYVWLPNTGQGGYEYFNRMYFAQQDRKGAVIDERNNGGGSAADYIVDVLGRRLMGYFNSAAGDRRPFTQPMAGLWGPKVMVINERAGSGGDLLPYLFRAREIGPLVGTRTWGGLVGTWDTPPLLDGGRMVAPRGGFFDVDGKWAVEGEGVAPDIEVRNDPKDVIEGRDPQLEAAVREALRLLETRAVELRAEPAPPVRWRRPEGWAPRAGGPGGEGDPGGESGPGREGGR